MKIEKIFSLQNNVVSAVIVFVITSILFWTGWTIFLIAALLIIVGLIVNYGLLVAIKTELLNHRFLSVIVFFILYGVFTIAMLWGWLNCNNIEPDSRLTSLFVLTNVSFNFIFTGIRIALQMK